MSKRDDDSQADMEVGMTTAERRRRRRRGGGLRVPSDNVPRRTNPPVVAPVPEDPSLAMSIAYSFQPADSAVDARSDDPSIRRAASSSEASADGAPIAPEAMSTMIDPPTNSGGGSEDFEMKTREMSAVDLEALGLSGLDPDRQSSESNGLPGVPQPSPVEVRFRKREPRPESVEVEVEMTVDPGTTLDTEMELEADEESTAIADVPLPPSVTPAAVAAPVVEIAKAETKPIRERKERLRTVALSDEDLEEVRESVARAQQVHEAPTAVGGATVVPSEPTSQPIPQAASSSESVSGRTQPLSALDIEVIKSEPPPPATPAAATPEIMSVPDIDIQELSERASDTSGEYEVDVEEADEPPQVAQPEARPAPAAHAPPPPPAQAKAPPTPPPAKKPAPPPKDTGKPRGKPWYVDLFDEDYLRTLPFLTPQATQSEAEFVIDSMQLVPGAQVLDVGCGYGRHAMELAARGFHVVGLDLSTPLLVRGGEEAMRRGLQINFVRGDIRELDFDAQFDGAYCLFSTFGYFDDETNKKAIANIARALKPGGKVLIEILNRDYVIADLPTRVWWEGDGCVVLEEVELNYFSSRIQVNRSVVFDDGRQLEQEISVRAYSLHEVGKLMHAAGFRVLEVSGGYQTRGRFFGNQSRHIIVLAERKDTGA